MAALTLAATITLSVTTSTSASAWPQPPRHRAACSSRPAPALCRLHWWARKAWRLEDARRLPRTRYWYAAEHHPHARPWLKRRVAWRHRARLVAALPIPPPWPPAWLRAALCVHHHEGAWNDAGAPYWGGLQMDMSFQAAYGGEFLRRYGTADRWPPRDQLLTAWRAWRVRGWSPWPNTAAMCGLL